VENPLTGSFYIAFLCVEAKLWGKSPTAFAPLLALPWFDFELSPR